MGRTGQRTGVGEHLFQAVGWRLGGLGLLAVLGISVLGVAAGGPEWVAPRHVTTAVLLLAGAAIGWQYLQLEWAAIDSDLVPYRVGLHLLLLVVLFGVLYQSWTPGYGLVVGRAAASLIVFVVLIAFCVLAGDPRRYSVLQWVVISGVATVVGIFFYHGLGIAATSGQARQPFWYGTIMAVGLVVLPQYLSRGQFLWAISRFVAGLVVLTLPMYVVGEYTLLGFPFRFHGAYTIPVIGQEVQATRSLFVNRNAFATVVFAGFIAAIGDVYQTYLRGRAVWSLGLPILLVGINGVGLAVSYGRALWVITPMALGIYFLYVALGRRAVPIAVVGGFLYLLGGIVAVQSGLLPLPEGTPTRADRWYPSIAAILDQRSVLGAGFVDPGSYIAPYQGGAEFSPHNSYLTVTIRAGLLGGIAYVGLVATSLLAGLLEAWAGDSDSDASVAMLALAVGYTAHQLFEAYTLFNWSSSTVLAILVFGFLVFGGVERTSKPSGPEAVDAAKHT
ncbi:hypothetical protein HWV07_07040 [Natronomonas salina]|uniref:O-antigen ligase family protein n=1 Tax=Natronomonas salina TaxID=1710540 RepID=UPI0015B6DEA6|nr:hypothetical protein [Natronomonas salina]QLD88801.1 hypothetical protein HWV07_07040 [Natronomonas salina]